MGDVYRARDLVLDREVAIKALPASMKGNRVRLSRFEREARLLASLNHPNIATLHGLEQVGEERFLVMELRSDPRFRQLTDPAWTGFEELLGILAAARERGEYPAYLDPALNDLLPLVGVPQPW